DLPDCFGFQSWCIAEREEVRRLRVRLLTALVVRLEGAPEEALPYVRSLALLEPAKAATQATLVRLLHATGRPPEAEAYRQTAERSLHELNAAGMGTLRQTPQLSLPTRTRDAAFSAVRTPRQGDEPTHGVGPRTHEFEEPSARPPSDRPAIAVLPFVNL